MGQGGNRGFKDEIHKSLKPQESPEAEVDIFYMFVCLLLEIKRITNSVVSVNRQLLLYQRVSRTFLRNTNSLLVIRLQARKTKRRLNDTFGRRRNKRLQSKYFRKGIFFFFFFWRFAWPTSLSSSLIQLTQTVMLVHLLRNTASQWLNNLTYIRLKIRLSNWPLNSGRRCGKKNTFPRF